MFPKSQEHIIRMRLAGAFRFIVSQRLIPRADGKGRVAAIEILKSTARTRDYVEKGEREGKSLYDAMRDGNLEGMQVFDGELERFVRTGIITMADGLAYSTNRQNLLLQLSDLGGGAVDEPMNTGPLSSGFVA
jgi:twitching motility protein PilT